MNIKINTHSSIQIDDLAFDPYDADKLKFKFKYIFLTHTHYDHLDIPSIKALSNKNTIIIATPDAKETLELHFNNKIIYVKPNDEINLENCQVEVLPSYNINKKYHKKEYGWVGYKVIKDGTVYAVLGDTDATPELENFQALMFCLFQSAEHIPWTQKKPQTLQTKSNQNLSFLFTITQSLVQKPMKKSFWKT